MECSGFYFQIEGGRMMLAAGVYIFTKEMLKLYRDGLVDKKMGPAFIKASAAVGKKGYDICGSYYKKVPAGYNKEHKNAPYLLYNALYAMIEIKIPSEFFSADFVDYSFKHFKNMYPLHEWLRNTIG